MAVAAELEGQALTDEELDLIDRYWRAANYLSVGQIYLLANPLLREPLAIEHVKPRLLGHWGTTPGLNFVYVHLNRLIRRHDLDMIYICGPGHGGPAMVANTYLEGTYSELYPNITEDAEGMQKLFRQFSFPGGIPSHAAPEVPGSIHEGGELGYALSHAFGAAFDNPDLIVACVVGDGEAETGPLAASWHSNKFLNPGHRRRRAADPAPERLQDRQPHGPGAHPGRRALEPLLRLRLQAVLRRGLRSEDAAPRDGRDARAGARGHREDLERGPLRRRGAAPAVADDRPADAQGLDGPEGGRRQEDRGLLALAPGAVRRDERAARAPRPARALAAELQAGRALRRGGRAQARAARARAGRPAPDGLEPARERRPAAARPAHAGLPRLRDRRPGPRTHVRRGDPRARELPARRDPAEREGPQLQDVRRGRARVEPARRDLRGHRPGLDGRHAAGGLASRRRGPRDGDPQRAHVPGVARGLPAHRPPRLLQHLRGVRPPRRLDVQPAREVAEGDAAPRSPGGGRSPRSTTCSPRTSGARTTTASPTRIPASSTTS